MDTGDLIKAMAAETSRPSLPLGKAWWLGVALAVVAAAAVFFVTLGFRPDIAHAVQTVRFLFKFVVTLALAISAAGLLRALIRPEGDAKALAPRLLAAPILLAAAIVLELFAVPQSDWAARLIGSNSMVCLTFIPLIGVGPLAVFLATLRHCAPTRPRLAGAVAGLLAGSLSATFYAAQCTDDSPLFVASWYTIAIAGLTLVGALIAPRIARW
ncbi:NrsF family protein [Mesorhizobium sp. CCNWLW179-1]|uniref:NrsF family protein n=1 Tax=unclassified Mesorhizobium TaxID=325217 RepID=UPI0030152DB3